MTTTSLSRADRRELERMFAPMAGNFVTAAKEIARIDDPLEAEAWASAMLGTLARLELIGVDDPLGALGAVVIDGAAKRKRPESLALLLAAAAVAPPALAERARQAAARMKGAQPPPWADLAGRAEPTVAWRCGDVFGDQDVVILGFAYPDGSEHSLSVLVDHNLGMAKDAYPCDAPHEVVEVWRSQSAGDPLAVGPDPIDLGDAAALIGPALETTTLFVDAPVGEDFDETLLLLQARLRTLPDVPADRVVEDDRDAYVATFLASPEAADLVRDTAEDVAELIVDFRCDYGDGRPLRWSPALVNEFLLDWVPRKVLRPADVLAQTPAVLDAWVRHAARLTGLAAHAVDQTLAEVEACRGEFADVLEDQDAFGPAKTFAMAMVRDGVDLDDEATVRR